MTVTSWVCLKPRFPPTSGASFFPISGSVLSAVKNAAKQKWAQCSVLSLIYSSSQEPSVLGECVHQAPPRPLVPHKSQCGENWYAFGSKAMETSTQTGLNKRRYHPQMYCMNFWVRWVLGLVMNSSSTFQAPSAHVCNLGGWLPPQGVEREACSCFIDHICT